MRYASEPLESSPPVLIEGTDVLPIPMRATASPRDELGCRAGYHGIHRGAQPFERVGNTHHFARDVVDTFTQHRMGHTLRRPGCFHLPLHDCHFLLEPDAFVIRRAQLLL